MRCPNCQTINPPEAKFCLECGTRLLICPNCGTVNLPVAKFCIECGTALLPQGTNPRPLSQFANNSGQPSTSASNGQTQPLLPSEERRVVTIMFADITGSTPLADRLDPEDMRAILTGYFNLMTEQIRRHGGTVEKYIGDAVMAVFGAPIAHEDDPDRAIRAALDMQLALADFNSQRQAHDPAATRLSMRIGINTGEVATPSNAQQARHDFLITGDAVNVAARLQQVATPDTILVGERTYLITREVFDFRAIAPLHLKGKLEPIRVWVVIGLHNRTPAITQHPRGIEGLEARLVGRTLELALMHATYARVQAEQRPHLITLLGVPGIGKSRLAREFIASEQEKAKCASSDDRNVAPRVLQGRCPPYGEGITYWPLIEILRSLLQVEERENADTLQSRFIDFVQETLASAKRSEEPGEIATAIMRSLVGGLSGNSDDLGFADRRDRERQRSAYSKSTEQSGPQVALLRAWRVLFEALAQQQPLILVIDDLQWADEALLDLLEYLTERITNVPMLFLCLARLDFLERRRDWGGGRRNFTLIALESLSTEESSELIYALLKASDLPEVLCHTILRRAEGNPFFVEEIVRMLIDQGVLVYEEGCWRIGPQNEAILSELATPAAPPEDTLIDQHYVLPLPRLPDTIQGVIAARVDLLNNTEKRLLQHASIIGRTFWLAGLLELAADLDFDIVFETLDALVQRDFIIEAKKEGRVGAGFPPSGTPGTHLLSVLGDDRIFSFKHILIRDVVYNNIPRMRRSQEHAQLALWLEEKTAGKSEAFAELLAYHYQQALATWPAGDVGARFIAPSGEDALDSSNTPVRLTRPELRHRSITYLTIAGAQALQSYHTIRAIQAYGEALELLIDSDADPLTLATMHEKLGDAYTQRSNMDEAWREYRRALQLVRDEEPQVESTVLPGLYDRLAELGARWLMLFNTFPDQQEVQSYIDAGLKLLEGKPTSAEHVAFLTYQALWYIRQVEMRTAISSQRAELAEQALRSGHEALRLAEELNDTYSLWITLDALVLIYSEHQKYDEAHKLQHRRLQMSDQISSRGERYDLYVSLGWVHLSVSDYPTAVMWFGRAESMAQTMESPSMLLTSMIGRMHAWYRWDRWDDAREVARSVLQMIEQYQQDEQWQLEALDTLAAIAYRTGDQEEGDHYLHRYKRLIDQHDIRKEYARYVNLAREDWGRASAEYKEKLQQTEPFPWPTVLSPYAELVVITGESAEVQQAICERAVAVADSSGARKSLAIALRARGRMHLEQQNWAAAEEVLQRALQQCEALDLPWERGNTLYCLGLFYRRRADKLYHDNPTERAIDLGRAHHHFEQALGFFEALKAERDAERARLALLQDSEAPV